MDTHTARAAEAADLTPDDRRRALQAIAERRAELQRELNELEQIEAGHRRALLRQDEPTGRPEH